MKNLDKVLNKEYIKCHYPFFWLCGNETEEDIIKAIERVHRSGCDGFTVESRGFPDFDKKWWEYAGVILKKAKELGMRVIFVDEDTFCPSGHAFALVNKPENDHLRRASLVEVHTDVIGPMNLDLVVGKPAYWTKTKHVDKIMGCYAYKRTDDEYGIDYETAIDLTDNIKEGILSCTIPEGSYRIIYVLDTMRYSEMNNDDFIDMLNEESVDLLINSIYKKYEELFSEYCGNTLMGFFSDEPFIGNAYIYCGNTGKGKHEDTRVGHLGITLPVNEKVKSALYDIYGKDYIKYIPSLWYGDQKIAPKFRNDYMNIVSKLYSQCFSQRIGKWCKDRGLIYIGHVLEDNNLHTRLGDGAGHYFRSQQGQTMAGIDIVLHQVMPGFADTNLAGSGAYLYENEFYHYILGKMASSAAHTYDEYDDKAMCEVTIGYGWAEGSQLAKWLFDYLLVRGTNFFVPGAVRPIFPDIMHAPHFGDNDGREPQFDGYCKMLEYSKKVLSAFDGSKHICNAAILYHAQAEWFSDEYMLMQTPAKVLYDNHIDFDLLSDDLLDKIIVENGKIKLKESYDCLVIPYAKLLPETLVEQLRKLKDNGADVVFVDGLPVGVTGFNVIEKANLAKYFEEKDYVDLKVNNFHLLRHYHAVNEGCDIYMFFNESINQTFNGTIFTGKKGNYNVYDFISDKHYKGTGDVKICLEPYQSCVVVYEQDRGFDDYVYYNDLTSETVSANFNVKLYSYEDMSKCVYEYNTDTLKPISAEKPTFSGKITYDFTFNAKHDAAYVKLSEVGENARLFVNEIDCGIAICKPFVYDISKAVKQGENTVRIEVYTTLANSERDPVSMFIPLAPTGIFGDIEILYK